MTQAPELRPAVRGGVDEVGDLESSAGDPRLATTDKGTAKPAGDRGDKSAGWLGQARVMFRHGRDPLTWGPGLRTPTLLRRSRLAAPAQDQN